MTRLTAFLGALVLLLSTAGGAAAASHQLEVVNFAFNPSLVKLDLGDTVRWHNGSTSTHTSTANVLSLWNQNLPPSSFSANITFPQAGTFGYHCTIHSQMRAKIKVRMTGTPTLGSPNATFVIRAANHDAQGGFVYDVQKRKPGKAWAIWRVMTAQTANFHPGVVGTWEFRSRLRRTGDGVAIGWSPPLTIRVRTL